ncbi:AsmA family protein [Pseudochelatococcus sp. B33]
MRDLFSVVAVLLVAVLCAALAVPYFVDWQYRRADVEAALGRAFGVDIHTEGAITVRLLPTPRLELERITVGGEAPFLTAEGLNVALEAPPLMSGRIEVTSARLVRPELRIALDEHGALRLPAQVGAPLSGIESAGVARLEVEQGTIRIMGAAEGAAAEHVIGPVNATASAPALLGPWRVDGHYGPYTVYAATGTPSADGRLRLKLRASDADIGAQADFDGHLQPGDRPGVAGRLALSLPLPRPAGADPDRLTATADIASEGWRFAASNLEIRSGEGAGAVVLNGEGAFDAGVLRDGGLPRVALDLDSRRIDIRPFVAAWTQGDDALSGAAERLLGGLPVDLSLAVGSVAYAGEEFGPASAVLRTELRPAGMSVSLPRVDLALPGGGRLEVVDGTFGSGSGFVGTVGFTAGDVGRLANAVKDAAANAATVDELGLMMRFSQTLRYWPGLVLRGHVEVSPAGVAVRALDVSAGESALSGDLLYTHAAEGGRARADARLALQGVDLAALPKLDPTAVIDSGVDLDIELEARRLRFGTVPASDGRRMAARFSTSADGVTIERFELKDPDGARLAASGHIGEEGGRIAATMEAENPAALLAFYRPFLPARWGEAFERAAPAIGPLNLEATVARPGAGSPLVAVVKGRAARTDVEGRIVSDPGGDAGDRAVIDLRLASPDAGGLLRQLGLAEHGGPPPAAMAGELAIAARGNSFAQLDGRASLSAGTSRLTLDGRWRTDASGASLSGPLQLETGDAGALAALLRRPLPATEGPVAASLGGALQWRPDALAVENLKGTVAGSPVAGRLSLAGDGLQGEIALEQLALADVLALWLGPGARPQAGQIWSSQRLGTAAPTLTGSLGLKARHLAVTSALALTDASLRVDVSPEALTVAVADTGVEGGGRAQGEIVLQRLGAQVNLRGSVALRQVALQTALQRALPALTQERIAGEAAGQLEFGASAESVAGLVGNLAGGGELRITGSAVPRFDASALERTLVALVDSATVDVDTMQVAAHLAEELDKGAWPIGELAAPLTLASGTLRFGPLALEAGGARAGLSGSFDLTGLTLDARAHLSGVAVPEGWSGASPQAVVVWRGPLDALERRVEAGSVANGLAAIGLTRELDRIERMEAEARERVEKARREREERARREEQRREEERREKERQERARQQQEEERQRAEAERARLEALAAQAVENLAENPAENAAEDTDGPDTGAPSPPAPTIPAPLDIRPDVRSPQ